MDKVIEVRNLVKTYDQRPVIHKFNFSVHKGECFGIVGPQGSGKSTLMKLLYCQNPPTSGELFILGLNSKTSGTEIMQRIGVVPQENGLENEFTVLDNLLVHARYFRIPQDEARSRALHWLRVFELEEFEKTMCEDLDNCMKKRLCIVRALLNKPDILFLDEPTYLLEDSSKYLLWNCFNLLKKENITLVVSNHFRDEVEKFCERILIIHNGQCIEEGQPQYLIDNHIGNEIVEFEVLPADIGYFIKKIQNHFDYQVLNNKVRLFLKENQSARDALKLFSSDHIHLRKAKIEDVFSKITA